MQAGWLRCPGAAGALRLLRPVLPIAGLPGAPRVCCPCFARRRLLPPRRSHDSCCPRCALIIHCRLQVSGFCYMLPVGLSCATSVRVSNALGAGLPHGARRSAYVATAITALTQASLATALVLGRNVWAAVFTSQPEVHGWGACVGAGVRRVQRRHADGMPCQPVDGAVTASAGAERLWAATLHPSPLSSAGRRRLCRCVAATTFLSSPATTIPPLQVIAACAAAFPIMSASMFGDGMNATIGGAGRGCCPRKCRL